ncbi:MAG: Bifunctional phosphoglucose/phosphomannose isomerase [Microgenomates group bacterium GW2011_GWC1_39_7b]|uniref:Bifunctional phosphoglucose/phosphomannose isomerase n=2 Tax=Candidatus Woeseibacteriota TaxID=1752722 RepID=A0A0G0P0S4_9BACT|nr:MAG: Bifunctional phosphoglucose/phosphomannose isomerase [Candidatus Woesebacteria bacterium GW2011_GWB1_39_10]KKR26721.1 MAG: Bifunctional phosphoglucose/phosphomannose isomerase [Microgenomates group bacterium GW2011_GWC1_39_7b]KKS90676.1 MAG: Bifunctional phosphoglucose/phosphomannose isomerase [Candidatus Woesebacteria bacterium GW2011_GWA1_43_12]
MNLDNFSDFEKIDPMKVGKALALFPDQIRECFTQATNADIPMIEFKSVLVSGMGGSSNAAKIIESLMQKDSKFPFVLYNDYGLPGWVDSDTLVIANSYSGNTEETLSAITEAKKRGSKTLGVSTGGKIAEMIKSGEIEGAVVTPGDTNRTGYPKTGLGVSLGALLGVLAKAGVIPYFKEDVMAALADLEDVRRNWLPEILTKDNLAKELAEWFHGAIPALFGGRPFIGSLNAGRNVICEVGRTFGLFFDFPEVDHVMVEATLKPDFAKDKIKYLFLESSFNHERVKLRYGVTKELFEKQGLSYKSYELRCKSELSQALEIPHLCAWIGYYLSILEGVDPGPEPWIIELKNKLFQPVH